jgi:hypothetical protein
MPSRADEFKRYVGECLAAAAELKDEEARAILIRIAETWQHLADQEDSIPQMPAPGGAEQPAMQQQQIQPGDDKKK